MTPAPREEWIDYAEKLEQMTLAQLLDERDRTTDALHVTESPSAQDYYTRRETLITVEIAKRKDTWPL